MTHTPDTTRYRIEAMKWGTTFGGTWYRYYANLVAVDGEDKGQTVIMATLDYVLDAVKERGLNVVNLKQATSIFKKRPKESRMKYESLD